jgi:2-iminobutanoate/2-iminopropanoate deaminase
MTEENVQRKRVVTTDASPLPGGAYSQAIVANGFVFTSGIGPHDPVTRHLVGDTVGDQTRQVLLNIGAILEAAGSSMRDVVKLTAHLADLQRDWPEFDAVCREVFAGALPTRTTVGSQLGGFLVEIDVVAIAPPAAVGT